MGYPPFYRKPQLLWVRSIHWGKHPAVKLRGTRKMRISMVTVIQPPKKTTSQRFFCLNAVRPPATQLAFSLLLEDHGGLSLDHPLSFRPISFDWVVQGLAVNITQVWCGAIVSLSNIDNLISPIYCSYSLVPSPITILIDGSPKQHLYIGSITMFMANFLMKPQHALNRSIQFMTIHRNL